MCRAWVVCTNDIAFGPAGSVYTPPVARASSFVERTEAEQREQERGAHFLRAEREGRRRLRTLRNPGEPAIPGPGLQGTRIPQLCAMGSGFPSGSLWA